jgi:hypothetical protein
MMMMEKLLCDGIGEHMAIQFNRQTRILLARQEKPHPRRWNYYARAYIPLRK